MGYLALLFTVVPLVDLWLLLVIGEWLGFWPTVWATILVAFVGAYLGKREGRRVLSELSRAMSELRMPEEGLVSGALVLVGAALLIAPGVITDAVGLSLLFPYTRRPAARLLRAYFERRFARAVAAGSVKVHVSSFGGPMGSPFGEPGSRASDDGFEVVTVDPDPRVERDPPRLLGP